MGARDGGPAFPQPPYHGATDWPHAYGLDGMTLRDYFAGKAMEGFAGMNHYNGTATSAAEAAYDWADAMIAARGK